MVALSLLASCSRAPNTTTSAPAHEASAPRGESAPQASFPQAPETPAPEPAQPAPEAEEYALTPPPAQAGDDGKDKQSEGKAASPAKPSPAPAATVSGRAAIAGSADVSRSMGFGAGHGRLGGAHKAQAPRVLAPAPSGAPIARNNPNWSTESYAHITENPFLSVASQPLSTFSVDVDTASYSNARRFLSQGSLPPKDAIRVEEWLNYFAYDYAPPTGTTPFAVNTEVTTCPWNAGHQLVRIGIKGQEIRQEHVPPRNLVFLLDVSGSMMSNDKLPLVKRGLSLLADNLRPQDSIAIAVYAGSTGLVLPATSGSERGRILKALDGLEAGGSTNGGAGIQLAYSVAQQRFKKGGINRVILATDGDFNVGTTSEGELQRLIEAKRKSGVFLTVLGFGSGNVKDSTMEMLANKGNGNYAYIDSLSEARKVLVREAGATLVTIAKDVKLQVEFNPARVSSYKLIGYENRLLAKEDFNDDKKDAGEIGAGHTVTALYEIVPKGAPLPATPSVDPLKYQAPTALSAAAGSGELLTVNVRYKPPHGDVSTKLSVVVKAGAKPLAQASDDYRFGVAVANVALLLRGSKDVQQSSLETARALAAGAIGGDVHGDRREFLALLDQAKRLTPGGKSGALTQAR
ncbi:MAG TPA: VWA domain-containing protein [Polyangiaceae bacterium]